MCKAQNKKGVLMLDGVCDSVTYGLQKCFSMANKPVDWAADCLGEAGKSAAPIGALGALSGAAVAVILGGSVIGTAVASSTVIAGAFFIQTLAEKVIGERVYFDIDFQFIGKNLAFVGFAALTIRSFTPLTATALVATLATYSLYKGAEYVAKNMVDKDGCIRRAFDFLNQPIDWAAQCLEKAGEVAAPVGALGAFTGVAVAVYLKGNILEAVVGSAMLVSAAFFIEKLAKQVIGNYTKCEIDFQFIGKNVALVGFLALNMSRFKTVAGLSAATTLAVFSLYQGVRYLSGIDEKI